MLSLLCVLGWGLIPSVTLCPLVSSGSLLQSKISVYCLQCVNGCVCMPCDGFVPYPYCQCLMPQVPWDMLQVYFDSL